MDLCLCFVSLLHCVVVWLFDCVLCPFYTLLWVGWCSVSLLHCVVGWSVFMLSVPSTLWYGLVSVCVLCPFFTVLWVGL